MQRAKTSLNYKLVKLVQVKLVQVYCIDILTFIIFLGISSRISSSIFSTFNCNICARAITATQRDYSTWTRWGRSSRSQRSNNCSSSSDRCPRRGRQHPRGNHRFLTKRFLHPRPQRPVSLHRVPQPVRQTRQLSIGCNEPRLRLLLRLSCQVCILIRFLILIDCVGFEVIQLLRVR